MPPGTGLGNSCKATSKFIVYLPFRAGKSKMDDTRLVAQEINGVTVFISVVVKKVRI